MSSNMRQLAEKTAKAAISLAQASTRAKDKALACLQKELEAAEITILAANEKDVAAARENGLSPHMADRLALDTKRLDALIAQVAQVKKLPDPTGRIEDWRLLDSGLRVGRLRIPLGVILFICEARPGAVIEAAALCLKSGNGIIIKGGKEMAQTAEALAHALSYSLNEAGLDPGAVTVLPSLERESLKELLALDGLIDLAIPRGGEGLIRFVSENSRIPVLKHYKGICHLYVDESADLAMAEKLTINSKTNRPSTCNSLEALLVHKEMAEAFLPGLAKKLAGLGVTIKACPRAIKYMPEALPAGDDDFGREFLDLTLAVKIVDDLDAAMAHIRQYGSRHTESIVTSHSERSGRFLKEVDASCVMHNTSTRLNDGGSLGLGAEIGISTTKIHAYGPMGLKELTTTKFVVASNGQIRE